MIRAILCLVCLLALGGCWSARVAPPIAAPTATAPAAPAAAAPIIHTGTTLVDRVSESSPSAVVTSLRPWLAGILTLAVVGVSIAAAWLRSKSLATLAAACAVGLAVVVVLKLVLWILAALLILAVLGTLAYFGRELWRHRAELRRLDPLHPLLTKVK